jgi:hypothetical protein
VNRFDGGYRRTATHSVERKAAIESCVVNEQGVATIYTMARGL